MDARRLDLPDDSFDVVFSLSSIEHFSSPRAIARAAAEMGRVLRPGGHAFIATECFVRRHPLNAAPVDFAIRLATLGRKRRRVPGFAGRPDRLAAGCCSLPRSLCADGGTDASNGRANHDDPVRDREHGRISLACRPAEGDDFPGPSVLQRSTGYPSSPASSALASPSGSGRKTTVGRRAWPSSSPESVRGAALGLPLPPASSTHRARDRDRSLPCKGQADAWSAETTHLKRCGTAPGRRLREIASAICAARFPDLRSRRAVAC